jgi:ABC-type glycerol-3-phosphate transport system permease component
MSLNRSILLWALIVVTISLVCFPLYWMAISSVKQYGDLFSRQFDLLPSDAITFKNYTELLQKTLFARYFLNSLIVAVLATAGSVIAAVLAGFGVTRFDFPGRKLIASSVLFTYMFPPILLSIPLFVMLKNAGLVNSLFGLALAHVSFTLPLAMWLAIIFFEAIPIDLDEAAMIDGAGRLRTLWAVILPIAIPGVVAICVFSFILSWNDYLFALVLIVDETKKTLPVGVAGFVEATSVEWGLLMAGGVLITLPVLIGFSIAQRWLIQGLGAGAVKG